MYPRYNMNNNYKNMYNYQNERLIGGGIVGPLLLGGLAGYAIGRPNYGYGYGANYQTYYYPYNYQYPNYYYNNFYY